MDFDVVSKNKIIGYLNRNSVDELYYNEFHELLNTKKKYTDENFLMFFVNIIHDVFDGKKTITLKMLEKLLESNYIFLDACIYHKVDIDLGLLVKIRTYKESYISFCNKNNVKTENNILDMVNNIVSLLETKYTIKEDDKDCVYSKKVKELEDKILELNNKIIKKDSDISLLEKEIKDLNKNNKKNINNLIETSNSLDICEKEIIKLRKKEEELTKIAIEYDDIKEKNILLNKDVCNLTDCINKQNEIITSVNKEKELIVKQEFLDNQIFELLIKDKLSIDNIIEILGEKGFCVDYSDVRASLLRIGKKVNIVDNNVVHIPQLYGIVSPNIVTLKTLSLNIEPNECKEFMLISDLHITNLSSNLIKIMNYIYDYCTINNIDTILNLGDFLSKEYKKGNYEKNLDLLNDIVKDFPFSNNIRHILLGGNHDEEHLIYGIDPIKYISEMRKDIIDMGYRDAFINFSEDSANNEFIMIHHNKLPNEKNSMCYLNFERIMENFDEFYKEIGKDRANCYIDILGHLHTSRLDTINGYCVVPSLTKESHHFVSNPGAWHMKIYFDENKKIKYIIFMPIIINNKLCPVSEQIYQKIKKL